MIWPTLLNANFFKYTKTLRVKDFKGVVVGGDLGLGLLVCLLLIPRIGHPSVRVCTAKTGDAEIQAKSKV